MTRFLSAAMSVFFGFLLASCGGGGGGEGEPAKTTVNLRETADYTIADAVQVVEKSAVVGVQADPENAGRTQALVSGTGYRLGQIVTVPQPVGSTEMFPTVGEVVSISEKNGTSTLGLVPAPLNRVYKSLSLNIDTQRDSFKILKVVTASPQGSESLGRKSRLDARRTGQLKFTNEFSETGADGLMTLKRAFEIPIEGNKKISATLSMDKLKATKIVQIRPGCSQPGCTMNEIGAYDQVATSISGDWSVEFSIDGDEFPGGIPLSLSSLIDTKQMWQNLKSGFGPLVLTGLDGADKEGLIPIFGLVLASSTLPPFSPIPYYWRSA